MPLSLVCKPHLRQAGKYGVWRCYSRVEHVSGWITAINGYGASHVEAYDDWKRQYDFLLAKYGPVS